jgi:hypothetical protein
MAGFNRIKEIVDAYNAGKNVYATFRKVPAVATTLGAWFDMSMSPGNPKANFYVAPQTTAATLDGNYGLFHFGAGRVTTDGYKFLHKIQLYSASASFSPAKFLICDYLLFYPLVDMDSTDLQLLTNFADDPTVPSLPRYKDGMGVKAFLVATNPYVGGARFQLTYTNEYGVSGRLSQWNLTNTLTTIGTIVHAGVGVGIGGAFIQLQNGDNGIRSVEGIQFNNPNGGLACLVLCKPLAEVSNRDTMSVSETDFVYEFPSLPKIYDGAYLNMLCMPNGSVAGVAIQGEIHTLWR